jgi:hypothetical protein
LEGSSGKQLGDPAKAAQRMLEVVESNTTYLSNVGSGRFSIWDQTLATRTQDIDSWRQKGIETAFDDAEFVEIQL